MMKESGKNVMGRGAHGSKNFSRGRWRRMLAALLLCVCLLMTDAGVVWAKDGIAENKLYAKAAVLMDADSGRVLFEKNGDLVLPMASTTKIMTCIVALENSDITKAVQISRRAAGMPDVQLNAREGDWFYLADLLYSLMLESHNDSAVAVAEAVAGSVEDFAMLMNQKAEELGCRNTYYITPNGLDARDENGIHSTTAKELARIMAYCVWESPQKEAFLKITQTPAYTFHNVVIKEDGSSQYGSKTYSVTNHNAFLHMMDGMQSGKTGFTNNAGYCYVGALEREKRHLTAVVLACGWPPNKTRKWSDIRTLMQYGIDHYTYSPIETIGTEQLRSVKVENAAQGLFGEGCRLELALKDQAGGKNTQGLLLKEGEKIEVQVNLPETLAAPVRKGQKIGEVQYVMDGEVYRTQILESRTEIACVDWKYCVAVVMGKFL